MDMLCCSPRSTSNLLERSGLFIRTDEEYELRVIVWEARAVATAPPKARPCHRTSAHQALPSSTRLRPMHCVCTTPTQKSCSATTRVCCAASVFRLGSMSLSACSRVARFRATTLCSGLTTARATPKATPSSTGACGGPCRPWRRRAVAAHCIAVVRVSSYPSLPLTRTLTRRRRCTLRSTGPMTR